MTRKFTDNYLLIASHNQGKIEEISRLLSPYGIKTTNAIKCNLVEPEETGKTFLENAQLKAKIASQTSMIPALSDDSGLVVDALGGDPGIYSARWAKEEKTFLGAMRKIESELNKIPHASRCASFICAMTLAWPDGHNESFEGKIVGNIIFPPRGHKGFGYDSIFIPQGHHLTFGEMNPQDKQHISHRTDAFTQLVVTCFEAKI